MLRRWSLSLLTLVACGEAEPVSPYPPCPECTALTGGSIFDGESVRPGTLILRGTQIDSLIYDELPPEVGTTIDASGRTILPGLIDLHVHAYFPPTADGFTPVSSIARLQIQALLKNGVTSYLDLGGPSEALFADREASRRNLSYPRIFGVGPMMNAPGGHPCVAGPSPACAIVDASNAETTIASLLADDPDALKLIVEPGWRTPVPTVDLATITAVVGAIGDDVPLYVHVTRPADLDQALDLGVRRFAHLPFHELMTEAEAMRLAQLDALVIPTMMFVESIDRLARGALDELDDPALVEDVHRTVIADLSDPTRIAGYTDPDTQRLAAEALAILRTNLALLVRHGVRIGAGTDAGNVGNFHGRSLRRELAEYVTAGMTPAQALNSATRVAADALGQPQLGRLGPGLAADLLIVEGDPLQDLSALGRVRSVFKAGAPVDLASLSR
jgi:imidazolonepropionase-like amidohydrolase